MPDPMLDKLSRFTPHGTVADQAAFLFAAGRASARIPWGWKAVVAGLVIANICWVFLLFLHTSIKTQPNAPLPPESPSEHSSPTAPLQPTVSNPHSNGDETWSYRAILSAGDLEQFPTTKPLHNPIPTDHPLTLSAGRRGEID